VNSPHQYLTDAQIAARARVESDDRLAAHARLLVDYDWNNEDEHLDWVITAPVDDLVAWAQSIEQDERDLASQDELEQKIADQTATDFAALMRAKEPQQ
jgi:hypothetical protein